MRFTRVSARWCAFGSGVAAGAGVRVASASVMSGEAGRAGDGARAGSIRRVPYPHHAADQSPQALRLSTPVLVFL